MEPTDLNSSPPDDAQLEAWLRASTALPVLPDDGFSRRVLTALPPPPNSVPRTWFCLGGALIGLVVIANKAWPSGSSSARLPDFQATILTALTQLSVPAFGLALGITFLSLWFAFRERLWKLPRW